MSEHSNMTMTKVVQAFVDYDNKGFDLKKFRAERAKKARRKELGMKILLGGAFLLAIFIVIVVCTAVIGNLMPLPDIQ